MTPTSRATAPRRGGGTVGAAASVVVLTEVVAERIGD
jgi:hypothetical protein